MPHILASCVALMEGVALMEVLYILCVEAIHGSKSAKAQHYSNSLSHARNSRTLAIVTSTVVSGKAAYIAKPP